MTDVIEQFARDGSLRRSWHDRFQDKWPNITTMMHQSEMTIHPQLHSTEYSEESLDSIYRNPKLPGWEGSNRDLYTDPRTLDHDILEEEVSTNGSSSKPDERKCEKRCQNLLCGFLVFSVVTVIIAAVGLSIFLTQEARHNGMVDHCSHSHGGHIDSDVTLEEQTYLSKKFCNLVKILLTSVDFPVNTGLASCNAALMFMDNSDAIHIEMHVSPNKGYTIREKIMRALKEEMLVDGIYRVDGKEMYLHTNGEVLNRHRITDAWRTKQDRNVVVNESLPSDTLKTQKLDIAAIDTTIDSHLAEKENAIVLGSVNFGIIDARVNEIKSRKSEPKSNVPIQTTYKPVQQDLIVTTAESQRTTLPVIVVPEIIHETRASRVDHIEETSTISQISTGKTFPKETTTFMTTAVDRTFADESQTSSTEAVNIEPTTEAFSQGIVPENNIKMFDVPIATKLFFPALIGSGSIKPETATVVINSQSKVETNVAAESLMAGGVMKFPLKTKSNFRFLLLSNPHRPTHSVRNGRLTGVDHVSPPQIKVVDKITPKWDIKNTFTEQPKPSEPQRTLRLPNQATRSYIQRKLDEQRLRPRKLVDVTTFG